MIEMTGTRTVYGNAWMTVREDTVRYPDGREGIYGYVEKRDFALVIPRTADGYWLVEEERYPVRGRRLGFPQGSWPPGRSGDGEALAAAELAEETVCCAKTRS